MRRFLQPFEQVDELAELRRVVVDLERSNVDYENAAADDARVITEMHDILRRQRAAGWWCPEPIATGGTWVRPGEPHECEREHHQVLLRRPKAA